MNANKTGRKSLDKLGWDPRVQEIFEEDGNGYWVFLKAGFWNPDLECASIHEHTIADVLRAAKYIEVDPRENP